MIPFAEDGNLATSASGPMSSQVDAICLIRAGGYLSMVGSSSGQDVEFWKRPLALLSPTSSGEVELRSSTPSQAIAEIRRLYGLKWDEMASLFAVSRRTVHFWASGMEPTIERIQMIFDVSALLRWIDRGSASENRALLTSPGADGVTPLNLMAGGQFEAAAERLGRGAGRPYPEVPSEEASWAKKPSPPASRVGALQDRAHPLPSRALRSKPINRRKS